MAELNEAITQAANALKSDQQFIFYLHGHARPHAVQLSPAVELSAQQLKELLAKIPQNILQTIILDSCYSRSFLTELSGVPNRIVITSADGSSKAWNNEIKSFSEKFIKQLYSGSHLYEAFKLTEKMMIEYPKIFGEQRPQLDDNQNGHYLESEEGYLTKKTFLGNQKVSASLLPSITEVHPAIYLDASETTALLWVKTSVGLYSVNKVEAILTNENDQPTLYQGEETELTRRTITLTPNYETQRFEATYQNFQTAKQWRIFYQIETIDGQWSDFAEGYVKRGTDSSSVVLEAKMNQTNYQLGDTFRFDMMIFGTGHFDLYVGLVLPHGVYYTIVPPFQFSAQNEFLPYQQNIELSGARTLTIFNFVLDSFPTMFPGEYQACGILTKPGSDPHDITNWVTRHCQTFWF